MSSPSARGTSRTPRPGEGAACPGRSLCWPDLYRILLVEAGDRRRPDRGHRGRVQCSHTVCPSRHSGTVFASWSLGVAQAVNPSALANTSSALGSSHSRRCAASPECRRRSKARSQRRIGLIIERCRHRDSPPSPGRVARTVARLVTSSRRSPRLRSPPLRAMLAGTEPIVHLRSFCASQRSETVGRDRSRSPI